jgi:ABC-2 type transport system permease protein
LRRWLHDLLPNIRSLITLVLQISTIARNTFIESIRQPIFFVLVMLCGIFQMFNVWGTGFALSYTDTAEVSGDNKLLLDIGLATVMVCGTLLAAFIATAVVSREIENKTVLTVVSKPVARPSVVVGKYVGVAGAIALAVGIMLLFLLIGIRHGVLSTAADDPDQPVIFFVTAAIGLSIGIAVWCNFFYGWYFSQTCMLLMLPLVFMAYILVLLVSKKWHFQPITTDFKPQITFACIALAMGLLTLTAVATAVSTRLGQVMTVVVCSGMLVFGLLSNYFVGTHAFGNRFTAIIGEAIPDDPVEPGWNRPGDGYTINLENHPKTPIRVGDPFYYSASPNGFPMAVRNYRSFSGNPLSGGEILAAPDAGLVVVAANGKALKVRKFGEARLRHERPPTSKDFVFNQPMKVRPDLLAIWAIIPNMHYFWLVDAITQNQRIPPGHLFLVAGYALCQIVVFLSIGVVLFQKRDVG